MHYPDGRILSRVEWPESSRPEAPISLDEAKRFARIRHTSEDLLAGDLLAAAIEYAETATRRSIQLSRWDLVQDSFPCRHFCLRRPPVVDVEELVYRDPDGLWVPMNVGTLSIDIVGDNAWVGLPTGQSWPAISTDSRSVRLRYRAGYRPSEYVAVDGETTPPKIPFHLGVAIKELFRWRFDRRGNADGTVPRDIDAMFWSERVDL